MELKQQGIESRTRLIRCQIHPDRVEVVVPRHDTGAQMVALAIAGRLIGMSFAGDEPRVSFERGRGGISTVLRVAILRPIADGPLAAFNIHAAAQGAARDVAGERAYRVTTRDSDGAGV